MDKYIRLLEKLNNSTFSADITSVENEPMKNHTSFKIGGGARLFVTPTTVDALVFVLESAKEYDCDIYVLGKGTNVLFDDDGIDAVVVSLLGLSSVEVCENDIICGVGASYTAVSKTAMENSLEGLSFAYGIPGTVGGAVFMNAGAYNGETAFVLYESTYLDISDMSVHTLTKEENCLSYRHSVYSDNPNWIILSATFRLKKGDKEAIKAEMEDFMSRRRAKQPLEYPSAGSTFKRYPGRYTGQMIDELGLKGTTIGGAQVSEKHGGFVINKSGATSKDVLDLIHFVQVEIKKAYGIDIQTEVIYVDRGRKWQK